MNKKPIFKIVKLLISQLAVLCMLFTNIVSASTLNTTSGTIYAKLVKNDKLTNEIFNPNPNGYLTINNIENVDILINTNTKKAILSGDIDIVLSGEINSIDYKNVNGYSGVFEGELSNGTYILLDITYTKSETYAILSAGYMGEDIYEISFFGETSELLLNLDNSYAIEQIEKDLLLEELKVVNEKNNSNISLLNSADVKPRHQGGSDIYTLDGDTKVGELNLYFPNEIIDGTTAAIHAKLNTATGTANYLKSNVYTDATAVYANPDKFFIKIYAKHADFKLDFDDYLPKTKSTVGTVPIFIPYINSSGIAVVNASVPISVEKITATPSSTYGNGDDTVYWEIYNLDEWVNSNFVGDEDDRKGMAAGGSWKATGSFTSNVKVPITADGKIRYRVSAVIDGRYKVYHFTTPIRTITRHITIKPN